MGGRGLKELERAYKETKIKAAVKLKQNKDSRMQLVNKYHTLNIESASYSLFKEANKYAVEFGISLEMDADNCSIIYTKEGQIIESNEYNVIDREVTKNRNTYYTNAIINCSWQGVNYKARIEDENIVKTYFNWLKNWRNCPTETVSEFFLLFYQLLPTKCYKVIRSKEIINDKICRICKKGDESIKHLMNNCEVFAKSTYINRHNDALKCFVFPFLQKANIIDTIPPWWSKVEVKPFYSNGDIKFWWDAPEYYGNPNEDDSQRLRPDAKIEFINEKIIFLVEMTVPWHSNREEKFKHKVNKYISIQQKLKFENPGYRVDQITLVIDSLGGYDNNLIQNIAKVIEDKNLVQRVITNMQKSVISSAAHLSRRCKISFI